MRSSVLRPSLSPVANADNNGILSSPANSRRLTGKSTRPVYRTHLQRHRQKETVKITGTLRVIGKELSFASKAAIAQDHKQISSRPALC